MLSVCSTTVQDYKKSLTALKIYLFIFFRNQRIASFQKRTGPFFTGNENLIAVTFTRLPTATVTSWSSRKCSQTEQDLLCKESLGDKEFEGKIGSGQILYNNAGNVSPLIFQGAFISANFFSWSLYHSCVDENPQLPLEETSFIPLKLLYKMNQCIVGSEDSLQNHAAA